MWWREHRGKICAWARLGLALGAAGLLAGCFQPLYGRSPPSAGGESVADKLAEVLIPPIPVRQGTPQARVAVELRNALQAIDVDNLTPLEALKLLAELKNKTK